LTERATRKTLIIVLKGGLAKKLLDTSPDLCKPALITPKGLLRRTTLAKDPLFSYQGIVYPSEAPKSKYIPLKRLKLLVISLMMNSLNS
jgi:hypothetical protein